MWNHIVARACNPHEPFRDFESAEWVWKSLRKLFPDTLAAVLMPNHLHIIVPTNSGLTQRKLVGLLGVVSRRQGIKNLWQPQAEPKEIPDIFHLKRQLRYVALNPCRKNLCADPLEWLWSTHRELFGAVASPKMLPGGRRVRVPNPTSRKMDVLSNSSLATQLSRVLGDPKAGFEVRFHAYVSADPTTSVVGTSPPSLQKQSFQPFYSMGHLLCAVSAALLCQPRGIYAKGDLRRLFIHLAYRQGWRSPKLLADFCSLTPRSVLHTLKQTPPAELAVAEICLSDDRFTTFLKRDVEVFLRANMSQKAKLLTYVPRGISQ